MAVPAVWRLVYLLAPPAHWNQGAHQRTQAQTHCAPFQKPKRKLLLVMLPKTASTKEFAFLRIISMRTLSYVVKPLFLILVFYPAFAFCAPADFMGMRMDRDFEIKGLTIPVEIASKGHRSLRIYCERVHLESKKVGIFRVGPMPQLVIHNMLVLLPADTDLATSATALDTFFNASPAWADAAIRGFKVCQMLANSPLLEAKTARIDATQGKVFLEKCLTFDNKSEKKSCNRSVMRLRGDQSGQVFLIRGRDDEIVKIFP